MDKCMNCQFYDRKEARSVDGRSTVWGQCRRHSPMLNPTTAKAYVVEGIWPTVRDDDWCGEWCAKQGVPTARSRGAINGKELMAIAVAEDSSAARPAGESRPLTLVAGDD